jgi:glycosyltransferase involved in cell wall biosynthesis
MIRILYVERPHNVGGSVISLYHLAAQLDRAIFDPVVLFHRTHPYRAKFAAIGVPTLTLTETAPQKDLSPGPVRQRDIAATLSRYSQLAASGYRTAKFLYNQLRTEWPLARRIRRIIDDQGIDLVHANTSLPNNRPTILAARWAQVPAICHYRMFKAINPFDRWLGRHLSAHVYISNAVASHHIAQGLPPENARVIHNAVDLEQFEPPRNGTAVRHQLGLRPEHLVVGNVGRLDWWKGHDVFLRAVAGLVGRVPNLRALIVGGADGRADNRAYVARLHALVEELSLADRVTFTGYRDDIPDVMAALDLVVHSSTEPEPFGRVVIEAMAARRPVVATAAGGVPEIVEDGVHGSLVPPGDAEALAEAMAGLLSDEEKAEAMARAGYQRVKRQFNVQAHAQAVQTLYRSALAAHRQPSTGAFKRIPGTSEESP